MDEKNMELYEKLSKLHWLLRKRRLRDYATDGPMADPTHGQGRILALLKMQDNLSTKDLSYLLGIRVSSLNEQLAKLEKSGYITREASKTDKRIMLVKLTEKGKTEKHKKKDYSDIFNCLSDDEQNNLGRYLDRMVAALENEIGLIQEDQIENLQAVRNRVGDEMFSRLHRYGEMQWHHNHFDEESHTK